MVFNKEMVIGGAPCTATVMQTAEQGDFVRLLLGGSYCGQMPDALDEAIKNGILMTQDGDESFSAYTIKLVPADTKGADIEEMLDSALNDIEAKLGISADSLSSSIWNMGHAANNYDFLLQKGEKEQLKRAMSEVEVAGLTCDMNTVQPEHYGPNGKTCNHTAIWVSAPERDTEVTPEQAKAIAAKFGIGDTAEYSVRSVGKMFCHMTGYTHSISFYEEVA